MLPEFKNGSDKTMADDGDGTGDIITAVGTTDQTTSQQGRPGGAPGYQRSPAAVTNPVEYFSVTSTTAKAPVTAAVVAATAVKATGSPTSLGPMFFYQAHHLPGFTSQKRSGPDSGRLISFDVPQSCFYQAISRKNEEPQTRSCESRYA